MKLEGQIAIVTGAGQGIGQVIALTLAKEGATVIANDLNLESAKKVVADIEAKGGKGHPIKADVTKAEEVNKLVSETMDNFKKIDILVNNAGWSALIPAIELTESQWDTIIDINLKSQFLCSQAVARHMLKQKRGKIVNIAALSGRVAMPGLVAYGASKAGIVQLTRVLAIEWAEYNINVNAVSPGIVLTPLVIDGFKDKQDILNSYLERIPLKRAAKPEDIANAVLFLASSDADDITGQEITIDGGTSALHPGFVRPKN